MFLIFNLAALLGPLFRAVYLCLPPSLQPLPTSIPPNCIDFEGKLLASNDLFPRSILEMSKNCKNMWSCLDLKTLITLVSFRDGAPQTVRLVKKQKGRLQFPPNPPD